MSEILRVRGLEKRFGPVAALRGVDLDLAPASALAILGPNGAGKSTLLRILAGLAVATAGTVEIAGGGDSRTRVGYLGHATLLYAELSARENLIFAGRTHRVADPDARADELLEQEGLTDVAQRRAGAFSRGMAQRLSIARACVHDPALMLLDEPYTGLDSRSANRLTNRLTALRREQRSLVLVTHDVRHASQLADETIILLRGKVVHRASGEALAEASLQAAYLDALERAG